MEQVRLHVSKYINRPARAAQDSHLLFHSIIKSIDTPTMDKIKKNANEYTVDNKKCGELLLRRRTLIPTQHFEGFMPKFKNFQNT